MVERPIKKSERQAAQANSPEESLTTENRERPAPAIRTEEGRDRSSRRRDNKKGGKGKGRDSDRSERPPVNPALMRGPKPTKPQPVVEEPEVVAEAESAEATEAEATEATEPAAEE